MINTESIDAFLLSLPEEPLEIERVLSLKTRLSDAIIPATASLAQRGYLACLPFAHQAGDEFVLRLLPGRSLTNCPVAVAWWSETEGMTIAPDISQFVAGAMAYKDVAGRVISENDINQLLTFASEFGGLSSAEAVVKVLDEARLSKDARNRKAILWAAAAPNHAWCRAISAAWQLEEQEAADWAAQAMHLNPEIDILWRIYTSYHIIYKTGVDVTEAALRLTRSDDVFDATYTGYSRGNRKGSWTGRPLVRAVKYLQKQESCELKLHPALWKAVQAFAEDPENYNGIQHLTAAQELASENPELAYVCAANAAVYYAHATGQTPRGVIIFAHELAVANGWQEVQTLLKWARTEMNL